MRPGDRLILTAATLQPCSHGPVQQGFQFARRRDCWDDRVGLFVSRRRCSRSEFLKARIIPQRIEHRIEPEQGRSGWRKLSEKFSLLFRRERGDDLIEARIATQ
jgi:hypothetical protein